MPRHPVLLSISQFLVVVAVPVVLTVIAVRIVMSPMFLQLEYNRPGFPEDPFGLTTEQRLLYAPPAVEYLLNNEGIEYLEDLRLPRDIVPVGVCVPAPEDPTLCYRFNERELQHMEDVKAVTRWTYFTGIGLSVLGGMALLYLSQVSLGHLRVALTGGSMLTFGIIGVIVLLAVTAWDVFFTGFHRIFFEGDSWLFRYSDTLIRLFPEQFWFDAALLIGTIVIVGAALAFGVSWALGRRARRRAVLPESNTAEAH